MKRLVESSVRTVDRTVDWSVDWSVDKRQDLMTANDNQIVVYQPNETVRLDVRLENETVWLNRHQMATTLNFFVEKRKGVKEAA